MKHGDESDGLHFRDIAPTIEFVCWVVVVLAPFLRWINGPAVTIDQFVVQITLLSSALVVAMVLRAYSHFTR